MILKFNLLELIRHQIKSIILISKKIIKLNFLEILINFSFNLKTNKKDF